MDPTGKPAPGPNTRLAHGGNRPSDYHGFVNPPVVRASTILFPDSAALKGRSQRYTYGLSGTPTTEALEAALSELEGAAGTILVPSGLAAVTVPLLAFLSAGDHLLMVDCIYGPTRRFANTVLKRLGVEVEYFDPKRAEGIADLIRAETKVVFLEAPGSNTFEMLDIGAAARAARAANAVTMIDNTWATPLHFRPLDHGVDISIHALTKYPSGHSDVLMGSVSANEATYRRLRDTQLTLGINAAPDDVYLVLRGLRSMGVRLDRHAETAMRLAEWLEGHEAVARVLHPALPSFDGHDLWKRQFAGASGLFSIVLRQPHGDPAPFVDALELFGIGWSWGGFESLAVPVDLSDRTLALAPDEGPVVRLQIGLEDFTDLRTDLERGLAALAARQNKNG
ncbi:cystathionine beta-lyase [Aureimonas leprariae]|uniref:cystathionine beta-lyase n=1 Tax=Plantimonas leprariae TaxID=2615207 RepID=UPI003CCCF380